MMKNISKLIDARDLHLYAGTAMLAAGAWLIMPAAGLIAPGLVFIYVALRGIK